MSDRFLFLWLIPNISFRCFGGVSGYHSDEVVGDGDGDDTITFYNHLTSTHENNR